MYWSKFFTAFCISVNYMYFVLQLSVEYVTHLMLLCSTYTLLYCTILWRIVVTKMSFFNCLIILRTIKKKPALSNSFKPAGHSYTNVPVGHVFTDVVFLWNCYFGCSSNMYVCWWITPFNALILLFGQQEDHRPIKSLAPTIPRNFLWGYWT